MLPGLVACCPDSGSLWGFCQVSVGVNQLGRGGFKDGNLQ